MVDHVTAASSLAFSKWFSPAKGGTMAASPMPTPLECTMGRWSVEDIVATPDDEAALEQSAGSLEELTVEDPVEKVVLVEP